MKPVQMISSYKRAVHDLLQNRYLNAVTIITIALSILIVGAFALFFINANDVMQSWKKGIRIMVYLKPNIPSLEVKRLQDKIQLMYGVQSIQFIAKDVALKRLRGEMRRQSSIFENLRENPLPDAFEVRMIASSQTEEKVEILARQLELLAWVDEVEYGQKWLGRFENIFNLFRLAGLALGSLIFLAIIFIVSNTIRLVLYSRREEVEIMRLVGAADRFIKAPFFIEGLIQGALGAIIGLGGLFVTFFIVISKVEEGFAAVLLNIRFLPPWLFFGIILCSMMVGWLGCYLSLKQHLKA